MDGLIINKKIRILDANEALCRMFGYEPAELLSMTLLDLVVAEARGLVLRNAALQYEQPYEALGLGKDKAAFPIAIIHKAISYQDYTVALTVVQALNNSKSVEEVQANLQHTRSMLEKKVLESTTQLRYAIERLRLELDERTQMEQELRVRVSQQAAVAELGQRALAGTDTSVLMAEAASSVAERLKAEYVSILETLPCRSVLLLRAGAGWPSGLVGQATLEIDPDSQAGYTLLSNRPIIVEDFQAEGRFVEPSLPGNERVRSGASVIIQGQDAALGVVEVHTTKLQVFSEDDLHFLQAVANILAMAIERKRAETQIKEALQEKQVLLKEIHHRVKNNLQIISSLLNLQMDHIDHEWVQEIFRDAQDRVRSIALIHEKLYQSHNLARVDMADYIRDLTGYLFQAHTTGKEGISLQIEAEEIILGIDTAVLVGLLVNELLINALKHAFPNGRSGEVRLSFKAEAGGRFGLTIADTGPGFPEGLDFQQTESLGLQLVNILVRQLEGTITMENRNGATFQILF